MDLNLILAIVVGSMFMAGLVLLTIFLIRGVGRIYVPMDEPFAALGFTAESRGGLGRRFTGSYAGREVSVLFRPRHKFASKFDVHMSGGHQHTLSVGLGRPVLTRGDWKRVPGPLSGLDKYKVYSLDPAWAASFLQGDALRRALFLLEQDYERRREQPREVYLRPGEVLLRRVPPQSQGMYRLGEITVQDLSSWLDALAALASLAEAA